MAPAGRLNSWKEIAAYLRVSVRTAQRWEKCENLPARRHKHDVLSSVFAYPAELDAWWHSRPDLQRSPVQGPAAASTAVLPFVNLNRDQEGEILSDGLTEELINALTRIEGLQVVARTSAFQFKNKTADIRAVGRQLGVTTVLEGSLRQSGDRLRVTAQLIAAADGCHLWSERFDRRMTDLFELQDEIARAIAEALKVRLGLGKVVRHYGENVESYTTYLEGRYHYNRRTRDGFLKAVACFQKVLGADGGMAPAWAGLADCHAFLAPYAGVPFGEALGRAKAAAAKALELDPLLPDAHCSLGFVTAVIEYDWGTAESCFRRALELAPDRADTHLWFGGHVLAPLGRLEEAARHARRACELDPLSPPALSSLSASWLMLRDADEALSAGRRLLDVDPCFPLGFRWMGEAYLLKGMNDEAASMFARIEPPVVGAGFLGYCHARGGRVAEARQVLRGLEEANDPSLALQVAAVHLGLGDAEHAFRWLSLSCQHRSMGVHWLKVEPFWDPLRGDPSFAALLKVMRLTD